MSWSGMASMSTQTHRDTPTDLSFQPTDVMHSVIYDESMITDDDDMYYQEEIEASEDDDNDNKPHYLQRSKPEKEGNAPVNSDRQRKILDMLLKGGTTYQRPPTVVEKWHPKKLDYNDWRKINLDNAYGTYYSFKSETVAPPDELPVEPSSHREPAEGHLFGGIDFYHMREKSYIKRISRSIPSPYPNRTEQRRFTDHIMQEYKKPLKELKPNGYGFPQKVSISQDYDDVEDVVETFLRPNGGFNVMPKRQVPEKCDGSREIACEFCDVLGPVACGKCIEATNRRIAQDVEEAAFPALDCSASSLVAPRLSRIMATYGKKQRNLITPQQAKIPKNLGAKTKTTFALPPIVPKKQPITKLKTDKQLSGILKKGPSSNRLVLPSIVGSRSPTKGYSYSPFKTGKVSH